MVANIVEHKTSVEGSCTQGRCTPTAPVRSFHNMQYVFVAYIYDLNAILVRAMPSKNDGAMIEAVSRELGPMESSKRQQHVLCCTSSFRLSLLSDL